MNDAASAALERVPYATAAKSLGKSTEKVDYIEYFRGLAIILIVAGHAFDFTWAQADQAGLAVSANMFGVPSVLITGSTLYFVFISGFLYRYAFYDRMTYRDFMRKKLLYVGLPYFLIGSLLSLYQIGTSNVDVAVSRHGLPLGGNVWVDYVVLMMTGQMMTAYWYIPFIMVMFLAAPLFDWYIRQRNATKAGILVVWVLLALWAHRPYENLNPLHSAVYFGHMYLFGILFCEQRRRIMPMLTLTLPLVALAAALVEIAMFQSGVQQLYDSIERGPGDGWWPLDIDLILIQKYVGVLLLCGLLHRWGGKMQGFLRFMARYSVGL